MSSSMSDPILPVEKAGRGNYGSTNLGDVSVSVEQGQQAVSFHNVQYSVGSWRTKKRILHGVSGYLPQGLNAIMGPTGSGKTSLLDILAGRKNKSGLSGDVLVNGERQPDNFKCIAGYVVQDDVVMGTLTVRENLHFSAALRLPSSTTKQERENRVKRVIGKLHLQNCADTKVGTELIRGVSGGERKRTNIGMELIIEPQVLFLDEPTSGLDAKTAVSIVEYLSREKDRIVIMSIHQPRYSIFKLFDTLTLLSQGSMVYHGRASRALEYFTSELGYPCEEHENPADFFLDVIIQCEGEPHIDSSVSFDDEERRVVDMIATYKQSTQYRATEEKLLTYNDILDARERNARKRASGRASYKTNIFWQLLIVCSRSFKNLLRTKTAFVAQMVIMIILALLVGILYLRLDRKAFNVRTVINDRIGAMFFIAMNQVFTNISAVEFFIKQRALFIHENVSGFYRVSAYFIAKILSDMLPMRLAPLVFYTSITYFMVGFQREVSKFFIYFLTVGLTSVSATSVAFAVSARVSITTVAILVMAMIFILSVLFGGFLVSLSTLPVWLRWIKYLSIFRYALEALSINEIAGQCFFHVDNTTGTSCSEYLNLTGMECLLPTCVNGTEDLMDRGYETESIWIWYDQIGLAVITVIFMTLAYINLRTTKKLK